MKKFFVTIWIFLFFAIVASTFLFFSPSGAEANQSGVNVGLTVTNCGNGIIDLPGEVCDNGAGNGPCTAACSLSCTPNSCGGPTTGDTTGPAILVASSSVSNNTFYIKWSLSDGSGISTTTFNYGVGNYNSSVGVVALGGNIFEVSISGLVPNTGYQYKITAVDNYSSPNTSNQTGVFTTTNVVVVDLVPPVISNVSSTPGVTTAVITFNTDELATSQVSYGSNISYGSSAPEGATASITHSVILPGLLPSHTYHFKVVATDVYNNEGTTGDFTFTTLSDSTPPPNVDGYQIATTSNSIILNWTNPSLLVTPDFDGVKIVRSINSVATGPNDPGASLTHTTGGQIFTDSNVLANVDYYYSIFSFDTSGNYSSGVYRLGRIVEILHEICGNGVDDDGNGKIDCADDVCKNLQSCIVPVEICNNGIDDDGDGKTDCADSDCASQCQPTVTEICGNGLDDDGDGLIDCADSDCAASCTTGASEVCGNGLDDDNNGKIDCLDSACFAFADCLVVIKPDEYVVPTTTVPEFARIDFSKLLFLAGNRQIILIPQNKIVTSLAGSGLSLGVPVSALNGKPKSVVLHSGGQNYQFSFSSSSETYFTDVVFPIVGRHEVYLEVDYGSDQFDSVLFYLNSLPKGEVSGVGKALSVAEVSLVQKDGSKPYLGVYGEQNPVLTDVNGLYGWVVPNGEYYLEIKKDGFHVRATPLFVVSNNVINSNVKLIKIAENLTETITAISQLSVQKIEDIANDPVVEKTATEVVAPAVVGVTAVGTVAAVSWFNLVSLLRFLFLQPLMLLGKRKREKWGMVYNSLTKLPVDLALVRLFNVETGRLVQSKVTDGQGRYAFIVDQGKYRLEAQKLNLVFPSTLLKDFKADGEKTDIYHGEIIEVTEKNSLITANVPLDPVGETKTPARIRREKIWRRLQTTLSWLGFLVTIVVLYISPVWYMWVLLVVHLFFLIVFRRLTKPKRVKGWGIVYDLETNLPVSRVVARLFNTQFNKLVASEVTDKNGRYHFLAGDSEYYVTYDHRDYEPTKLDIAGSTKKGGGAITEDIKIKKKIS